MWSPGVQLSWNLLGLGSDDGMREARVLITTGFSGFECFFFSLELLDDDDELLLDERECFF